MTLCSVFYNHNDDLRFLKSITYQKVKTKYTLKKHQPTQNQKRGKKVLIYLLESNSNFETWKMKKKSAYFITLEIWGDKNRRMLQKRHLWIQA